MKGNKTLSEAISIDNFKDNYINLIKTPCGSGKTYFSLNTLNTEGWYPVHRKVLLIDTIKGKQQILKQYPNAIIMDDDYWLRYDAFYKDFQITDEIIIMCYASFGILCSRGKKDMRAKDFIDSIDVLICDEFHKLFEYMSWSDNNNNTEAWNGIVQCCCRYGKTIIALTATPDNFMNDDRYNWIINNVSVDDDVREYETTSTQYYNNLTQLLSKIEPNKKGIIYIKHITQIIKYMKVLRQKGIKCEAIWSEVNTKHKMSEEQLLVNNYIIENQAIPDSIDVLFINASAETSINIYSHIDFIIVHSNEQNIITQARGRYRNDLDVLYCHDSECMDDIIVPTEYLNKPLYKEDVKELIKLFNIRDEKRELIGSRKFCNWLEMNGYLIEKIHTKKGNYTMIKG